MRELVWASLPNQVVTAYRMTGDDIHPYTIHRFAEFCYKLQDFMTLVLQTDGMNYNNAIYCCIR